LVQLASTASRSNVRDDRDTPLKAGRDDDGYSGDLGWLKTGIFFRRGLDRANQFDGKGEFFLNAHSEPGSLAGSEAGFDVIARSDLFAVARRAIYPPQLDQRRQKRRRFHGGG
jgi:hypothetical protein